MAKRIKEYESMSLEELKVDARYPLFLEEFMNIHLYNNPQQPHCKLNDGFVKQVTVEGYNLWYYANNHPIGFLKIEDKDIYIIAVHPDHRRQGIAKKLIAGAIKLGAKRFYGQISPDIVNLVWWFYHEQWRYE